MSLSVAGGRYQPIIAQAEITRTFLFDHAEAHERHYNTQDNDRKQSSYPLGDKSDLKVMPGEIVLARRAQDGVTNYGMGRAKEIGLTSLNGLNWGDYGNPNVAKWGILRSLYFGGIAKTEYEDGNDSYGHHDPLEHGFATIGSGSFSVPHLGPDPIHAGDLLALDIPEPGSMSMGTHMRGKPPSKLLAFLRPLHKIDSKPCLLAIVDALNNGPADTTPGIQGMSDEQLMNVSELTPLQEEAYHLRKFLTDLGFATKDTAAKYIADNMEAFQHLLDGMMSVNMARMQLVVGKAISSSVQGQTTSVMLSHYKCV